MTQERLPGLGAEDSVCLAEEATFPPSDWSHGL